MNKSIKNRNDQIAELERTGKLIVWNSELVGYAHNVRLETLENFTRVTVVDAMSRDESYIIANYISDAVDLARELVDFKSPRRLVRITEAIARAVLNDGDDESPAVEFVEVAEWGTSTFVGQDIRLGGDDCFEISVNPIGVKNRQPHQYASVASIEFKTDVMNSRGRDPRTPADNILCFGTKLNRALKAWSLRWSEPADQDSRCVKFLVDARRDQVEHLDIGFDDEGAIKQVHEFDFLNAFTDLVHIIDLTREAMMNSDDLDLIADLNAWAMRLAEAASNDKTASDETLNQSRAIIRALFIDEACRRKELE